MLYDVLFSTMGLSLLTLFTLLSFALIFVCFLCIAKKCNYLLSPLTLCQTTSFLIALASMRSWVNLKRWFDCSSVNFLQNLEDSADMEPEMCVMDDGAASGWAESRYLLTFASEGSMSEGGWQSSMCSSLSLRNFRTTAFKGRSSRSVAVVSFSFTLASSIVPVSRSSLNSSFSCSVSSLFYGFGAALASLRSSCG